MRIVDKKELFNIDGRTYQVSSIKTGEFYTGAQVIFKRVIVLWITGLAIELSDSKVYLKHFKHVLNPRIDIKMEFGGKWNALRKPLNYYERINLIKNSAQIRESNPLTALLDNIIKTIK